MQISLKNAVNT